MVGVLTNCLLFPGAGGLPSGGAQGAGESQTGPRQTHQDARVRPETGKVSRS